jgi:hypothetical protein
MLTEIWEFAKANDGCSSRLILAGVKGHQNTKSAAIETLERAGRILVDRSAQTHKHHAVPYEKFKINKG